MDPSILEDIGLTNAEIKVYLALLALGQSTAGPIIEKSGLQSSVVYMTFQKLLDKGFLSTVKEGKRTYYQSSDPKHILEYIDEKKERFESLLPELLVAQTLAKNKSEATLFQGIRGVKELFLELLDAGGKEHHTFGSSVKSLMIGDAWWVSYHAKRAKRGIYAKLLFNESLKKWDAAQKYRHDNLEVRYHKAGFEPLTETIIRNDKVGIIIWTDKSIGILIHSKEAADSYDKYWKFLWDSSK